MKALMLLVLGLTLSGAARGQAKVTVSEHDAFPPGWTLTFLDESQWDTFIKLYHPKTETAFTVLDSHVTFIRDSYATSVSDERLRHTLLHEAGHAQCGCTSELEAEKFAKRQSAR